MTDPSSSSGLRIGGFALLGVGVVAALIGLVSVARGDDSTPNAAGQSSSVATAGPSESASESGSSKPSATASLTGQASATGIPSTAIAAPTAVPAPAPVPAAAPKLPLRVYNNSANIKGLASGAAADFQAAGWTVTAVANYSSGNIPTSTVYFRPGTGEEASARQLGTDFGLRVEERFAGIQDAAPGLIVIVTNDYQRR